MLASACRPCAQLAHYEAVIAISHVIQLMPEQRRNNVVNDKAHLCQCNFCGAVQVLPGERRALVPSELQWLGRLQTFDKQHCRWCRPLAWQRHPAPYRECSPPFLGNPNILFSGLSLILLHAGQPTRLPGPAPLDTWTCMAATIAMAMPTSSSMIAGRQFDQAHTMPDSQQGL